MTTYPRVRWGILATGKIAGQVARDLALLDDAELLAVGSRSLESAQAFADEHGAARAHGSYAELAADPDVDVVYVATPHGRHVEDVTLCLEAGRNVLCEKSLTLDAPSGRALADLAAERGLLLLEAMWTRCNPRVRAAHALVAGGGIGEVGQLRADLGIVLPPDPGPRFVERALGAGGLLDVGVYPLTVAHLFLGMPSDVRAAGVLSDTGIDLAGGATLTYPSGAVASVSWSQVALSDARATVAGTTGRVDLASRMHHPPSWTHVEADGTEHLHEEPVLGRGYAHELLEVHACLRAGRTTSALLPMEETLEILEVMDEVRAQIGLVYPS